MSDLVNEWLSEYNEIYSEWVSECKSGWVMTMKFIVSEWMSGWVNTIKFIASEWVSVWVSEWKSGWVMTMKYIVSEWLSEWVKVCVSDDNKIYHKNPSVYGSAFVIEWADSEGHMFALLP